VRSDASVTYWLALLKAGDRAAAQPLWERYFRLLVSRARAALGAAPRRAADEEDVALSAFDSFCRGAEQGHFPRLDDRNDLWRLLFVLTVRKAGRVARDERRARRGGGRVVSETDLAAAESGGEAGLLNVIAADPSPELAAQVADECRLLLKKLGDDDLRAIAVLQMQGYTVDEIAAQVSRSARTIARKLLVIRERWQKAAPG
jgi:DNA-directed RNA polymerase specialized sigma24 family protein